MRMYREPGKRMKFMTTSVLIILCFIFGLEATAQEKATQKQPQSNREKQLLKEQNQKGQTLTEQDRNNRPPSEQDQKKQRVKQKTQTETNTLTAPQTFHFMDSLGGGKPISLYNGKVPNSKRGPASYKETNDKAWSRKVTDPEMIPFLPDSAKRTGTAIVICPGGGYSGLSVLNEGAMIAKAFKDVGITAFVLKYRLPSDSIMIDKSVGPLQDAQRAIKLVRMNAANYGIDINKVGIIGFSAGGHVASTAVTHFDTTTIANTEQTNLRPDFAMLLYPVISFGKYAHKGSRRALVAPDTTGPLSQRYSNELQVTDRTPPTFLVHATDDKVVPVENSVLFYQALLEHKVTKSALFIFQEGGHGFGINNKKTSTQWFDLAHEWLKLNGF